MFFYPEYTDTRDRFGRKVTATTTTFVHGSQVT